MTHVQMTTQERFPRKALIAAGALIFFSIVVAAAGRYGDIGTVRMPPSAPVTSAELQFVDRSDGSILIRQAGSGETVTIVPPESNGFIRGVMRGMARERMLSSIGAEPPFELTRRANGTLTLVDPETMRRVELDAFGPTNAGAFAAILDAAETLP
jgi:putative photosynthetic complex assembly protein